MTSRRTTTTQIVSSHRRHRPQPGNNNPPPSYKSHFKHAFQTSQSWLLGPGRLLSTQMSAADNGVVTSLAFDGEWIVVAMETSQVHVFEGEEGGYVRTLEGHQQSGVWCLSLVSKGGGGGASLTTTTGDGDGDGDGVRTTPQPTLAHQGAEWEEEVEWASAPEVQPQQQPQRAKTRRPRVGSSSKARRARPREGGDSKGPCWSVGVVIGPCACGTSRRGESRAALLSLFATSEDCSGH